MTTTLITGANRSLGYTTAQRLVAAGHDVIVAARDPQRGAQAADELGARFVQLDVTDADSIRRAAEQVEHLYVLVNNAGNPGELVAPPEATAAHLRPVFEVNVFGIVEVTHAFLPHLERSTAPVIVNVTSGMGSMAWTADPDRVESSLVNVTYSPSKAAVNMLTTQYARALPRFRVNAVDPGYTATDFNGHNGTQTVEEGTDQIVAMAQVGPGGPTGTYTDRHGVVPW